MIRTTAICYSEPVEDALGHSHLRIAAVEGGYDHSNEQVEAFPFV